MMTTKTAAAIAALSLVAACGGGDSGNNDGPPVDNANAEGFWEGETGAGDPLALMVTDDGKLWGFHLSSRNGLSILQGSGSSQGKNYTASGKAFSSVGAGNAISLSATVEEKKTLQGNVSGSQAFSFKTTYDAVYEQKASLDDVKGNWSAESGGAAYSTTISESGALTGHVAASGGRCDFSGSVAPHASKNYFRITVKFANNCASPYAGTSTSGIALITPASAGQPAAMLGASVSENGSFLFPLAGVRSIGG